MSLRGSPKFLVIRRDNIGDLVCTTPLIAALRNLHPQAYIGALVNSYNRDILHGNPDVDEVFAYTKAKHRGPHRSLLGVFAERAQMLFGLRRRAIDLAILAAPGFQARSLRLARWAGARRVLGFVDEHGAGNIDLAVPYAPMPGLHEVEDVFRLAPALGVEGGPPPMRVSADPDRLAVIRARIAGRFDARQGPLICLHISARKTSQRWPAECFVALAKRLCSEFDARLMLVWAPGSTVNPLHPGDDEKADRISGALDADLLLAYPTRELGDLIAAVAASDLVICADGGAMHIAAALGKPIVCLFGDSAASRWYPWKTRYELLQPPSRDVRDISVDEVMSAMRRAWVPVRGV